MKQEIEDVVREVLASLDLDLYGIRQGGTRRRPLLEVRVDRRDGADVTIEDCARASRAIEQRLDGGTLVASEYVLQVSSPGAERPLRDAADWRRFVGRWASVAGPLDGERLEAEIIAVEEDAGVEVAVLREADGTQHRLPLADVGDARLAIRWTK